MSKKESVKKRAETLTFHKLREYNKKRCEKHFHNINDWSGTDWACALSGEVGELCNFIKKLKRGEKIPLSKLAKEMADIATYLDLLAESYNVDLAEAVIKKFNEVSDRKKSKIKL